MDQQRPTIAEVMSTHLQAPVTNAQFFEMVRTDNWLFPELGEQCVRVDSFTPERDLGPIRGNGALLICRTDGAPDHPLDVSSNLATIGQIWRSFGQSFPVPLPATVRPHPDRGEEVAISGVSWHASLHDDTREEAPNDGKDTIFMHVSACYRRAVPLTPAEVDAERQRAGQ